jgi:imidazolonepropionase-like amidohydrolase
LFRQRKNQRTSVSSQSNPLSKYRKPFVCERVSIANATVLDSIIEVFNDSSLLLQDGKIVAIGNDLEMPDDGVTIDAKGKWVTLDIIDMYSQLGVYPAHGGTAY